MCCRRHRGSRLPAAARRSSRRARDRQPGLGDAGGFDALIDASGTATWCCGWCRRPEPRATSTAGRSRRSVIFCRRAHIAAGRRCCWSSPISTICVPSGNGRRPTMWRRHRRQGALDTRGHAGRGRRARLRRRRYPAGTDRRGGRALQCRHAVGQDPRADARTRSAHGCCALSATSEVQRPGVRSGRRPSVPGASSRTRF